MAVDPRALRLRRPSGGLGLRVFPATAALVGIASAALVLFPVGELVRSVFYDEGEWRIGRLLSVLGESSSIESIRNTVLIIAIAGSIALVVASFFAWANERTDARIGWLTDTLPLVPMFVPSLAGAVGWTFLLSPTAGYVNVGLRNVAGWFGADWRAGPLDVFTWYGLIGVYALYLVPFAYLVVSAALRNLDSSFEEAAQTAGAGTLRRIVSITLPSIRPAIAAGAMLILVQGLALFSIPIIIGTRAQIRVLPVDIVVSITRIYPPEYDRALGLGLVLIAMVGTGWWFQRRYAEAGLFAQIAGKSHRTTPIRLGRWRILVRACMLGYLGLAALLPFAALVTVSLQPFWTRSINWDAMSFEIYDDILFHSEYTQSAFLNSLRLAAIAATLLVLIASLIAAYGARKPSFLGKAMDGIAKLPAAIPHVALGVGFILFFTGPPFHLEGTMLVLLLAYVVSFLPHSTLAVGSSFDQVGSVLTEASRVSGAGPGRTYLRIQLPLVRNGIAVAWALAFVLSVGELSMSAMLARPNSPVVGFAILDMWENGSYPGLAALATIMTLGCTVLVGTVLFLFRKRVDS